MTVEVRARREDIETLCYRQLQIEADTDVLFVPGVSQAAQSLLAKTLKEAEKEAIRIEGTKKSAPSAATPEAPKS